MKGKVVILFALFFLICGGSYMLLAPYFGKGGKFDTSYSHEDLETNYISNKNHLLQLTEYLVNIIPDGKGLSFGYDKRDDKFYIVIRTIKEKGNVEYNSGQDLSIDSKELHKLVSSIGWSNDQLNDLLDKMTKADCVGVFKQPYPDSPVKITYRTSEISDIPELSYIIFLKSLNDSIRKNWENKVGFEVYDNNTIFEYGHNF